VWFAPGPPLSGQTDGFTSFVGGRPALPPDATLPHCGLCGAPQTFFFQVAFPAPHSWAGRSLAVFACTRCADDASLIPPMLEGALAGADIPEAFLDVVPANHRFLVFETARGRVRADYVPLVAFRSVSLRSSAPDAVANKVGGRPTWLLGDEAPATYARRVAMTFLLQLLPGTRFDVEPGAPAQMTVGLDGRPTPTGEPYYELFIGNAVYLFGTATGAPPRVYALTQVD
jgi:hypothetical protein